ncbi:SH3 domain-containing protein [Neorhizobium sp. AL 9.2.2]|jgi:uncharacterized protein YraI|nr:MULTISPECIES: SH3 domain-containing protein [Rhizobium/Agrobacterium group]NSY19194.1 SH3 domain-containing protein [Neorhizobium sp. AL 9.2.2]
MFSRRKQVKKLLLRVAALGALMLAPSIASAAVQGFATANVNMRSGPSTAYPAVTVIPVSATVTINGCMSSVNWCDVSFYGGRGWVSGNYVQAAYRSNRVYVAPDYYQGLGIPTVTFEVNDYWGRHYRERNFYRERDRWRDYNWRADRQPPPPPRWDRDRRPPPPPPGWDRDRDRDRWDNRPGWDRDRGDRRDPPRVDRDRDDRRPPPRIDRDDDRRPPPPRIDRDRDDRRPPPRIDRDDDRRPPPPRMDRGDDRRDDRRPPPRAERNDERREERRQEPRAERNNDRRAPQGETEQCVGPGCRNR